MRKRFLACLITGFFVTSLPAQETVSIAAAEQKRFAALREYDLNSVSSNNFDVNYYRCNWEVDPAVRYISGSVTSYFTITAATNNIVYDLSTVLNVDSVYFRGSKISFTQNPGNALQLNFGQTLSAGELDSVSIFYRGVPPSAGAFTQSTHNSVRIIWTLSEPYGARTWWPCKDMLRDKPDSIDIIITNPSGFISSSNGLPVSETVNGAKRTTHWKHRYPIAPYLVAFAITNYTLTSDAVNLPSGSMPVVTYSYPEALASFTPAIAIAKFCLVEFSKLITEYPFARERYAQTQFGAGGGMEHQTNSFIVNAAPGLVAHELGHQWFGNKITCASWSDLWLNEGFATYMEYLHTELSNPSGKIPMLQSWRSNITQSNNGSVYVLDTLNEARLFSSRLTYRKGGYLVHMLRWKLGDSTFFRGVRRYMNDPALAYKTAFSADLQRNLEQESGQNLTEFFNDWLYGEGHADYSALWSQSPNLEVQVKLNQTPSHASVSFFEMPVPLRFTSTNKDTTIVVNHIQNGQIFTFNLDFIPQSLIIDPELWILTKNKTTQKVANVVSVGPVPTQPGYSFAPNPVTSKLRVSLPGNSAKPLTVELTNTSGQVVYRKIVNGTAKQFEIATEQYPAGVYWIRISDPGQIKLSGTLLVGKR